MSASKYDKSCIYGCGVEHDVHNHFVFEHLPATDAETGESYVKVVVHPCVYIYEQEAQLRRITPQDIENARIAATSHCYSVPSADSKGPDKGPKGK